MIEKKIVVVGSGPAGLATALSLAKIAPKLAENMVILEREKHPRPKLCGGGVTALADEILRFLEVETTFGFPIHWVRLVVDHRPIDFHRDNLMRIVYRPEFDGELAAHARRAGLDLREDEAVVTVERVGEYLEVQTERRRYRCRVLVAADGAKSLVRRNFFSEEPSLVSRLMEVAIQVNRSETVEFCENIATLDFSEMQNDLQGYVWEFPALINGSPHMNIGIFDSRVLQKARANLRPMLARKLESRGLPSAEICLQGHPERWFAPTSSYARPNVILVGDAAGVEPLFGEGISFALAYGPVAARTVTQAFQKDDFSFSCYRDLILRSRLGKLLNRNRRLARCFYRREFRYLGPLLSKVSLLYFKFKPSRPINISNYL